MNQEEIRKQFELNVIKDSKANGDSESCTNALIQRHKNGKYLYAWQEDNFNSFYAGFKSALASKQEDCKDCYAVGTTCVSCDLKQEHIESKQIATLILGGLDCGEYSDIDIEFLDLKDAEELQEKLVKDCDSIRIPLYVHQPKAIETANHIVDANDKESQ